VTRVDGDDATERRIQVGDKPEDRAIVIDEVVDRIFLVEQWNNIAAGLGQVLEIDAVLWIGTLADLDDQVMAIVGYAPAEAPLLVVVALVDQRVC
jgi:hypothetical protein